MWTSVASSEAEPRQQTGLPRLGPSFRLLMQVRALVTAVALFALPNDRISAPSILLISGLTFLYWLAAHYWQRIVPQIIAHPLLTGIDLFVSFTVLTYEGPDSPFFQSTIMASAAAGLLFRWRGMLLVSAMQIVSYFAALGYYAQLIDQSVLTRATFQTLFSQPAYYLIVGLVGVMLRRLFDQQLATEAAHRSAEVRTVAADERARLAREMHDSLAKTLRGIAMSAQALPVWVRKSPDRAASEAQRIASSAEVASREARELIADLRDDQVQKPLAQTVREVGERWSDETGTDVSVELDDQVDLPLVARYELISILKEALTNIDRHARAGMVTIRLAAAEGALTLTISDDGTGFSAPGDGPDWLEQLAAAGHYGVVGMYERAKRAGGRLSVHSDAGTGTTLTISFTDEPTATSGASGTTDSRKVAEAG